MQYTYSYRLAIHCATRAGRACNAKIMDHICYVATWHAYSYIEGYLTEKHLDNLVLNEGSPMFDHTYIMEVSYKSIELNLWLAVI